MTSTDMDNETPIYNLAETCDDLFSAIVSTPGAASALVAEVLHRRFKQWISYLGVFAPDNVSLDTRLRYSKPTSDLVLQFLQIMSRNLDHVSKFDEGLGSNEMVADDRQRSVVDEFDLDTSSKISSPLVESLRALQTAIDGLYRLGAAIRQSTSVTLDQRIRRFAQDNEDVAIEKFVFLRLKHEFFDNAPKESNNKSPLSLYRQLASSISFRHLGLLYRQSHQRQLEKIRDISADKASAKEQFLGRKTEADMPSQDATPLKPDSDLNQWKQKVSIDTRAKQQPAESIDRPSTFYSKQFRHLYHASENSFAAPRSTISVHVKDVKYPEPPEIDRFTRQAKCTFCGKPFSEMDLKKKYWWPNHVKQDLKLYACLSEMCAEPPQLFARFHEWTQHMKEQHSAQWVMEVHKPLGWCCDVEHMDNRDHYFEDEDEYDQHVYSVHPEYEHDGADLKEWSEYQRERLPYTCPICNCIPEELAVIFPWLNDGKNAGQGAFEANSISQAEAGKQQAAQDKLLLHIGTHLKQLGLWSVAYMEDGDKSTKGSKRGSIPVDENGKLAFVDNPPDYLDPQHEEYTIPTEPELLEMSVNWSPVKILDISHDYFLVPFLKNPLFVGHETLLAQIEKNLFRLNKRNTITIMGLSGTGKTQLVVELLYRTIQTFPRCLVFWVNATSFDTLDQSYIDIAQRLDLSGWNSETADVKKLVHEFLYTQESGQWLLVFDGFNDSRMWTEVDSARRPLEQESKLFIDYIPFGSHGTILFTTQSKKIANIFAESTTFELSCMDRNDAAQLWKKHRIKSDRVDDHEHSMDLIAKLGYFPLAITQAARKEITTKDLSAYLVGTEYVFVRFLMNMYVDYQLSCQVKDPGSPPWFAIFQQFQQSGSLASKYLFFMACVNPKEIPVFLLQSKSSEERELAIWELDAIFFVTRTSTDLFLNLHQHVHLTAREWLRRAGLLTHYTRRAVSQMKSALASYSYEQDDMWLACVPHVQYIFEHRFAGVDERENDVERDLVTINRWNKEDEEEVLSLMRLFYDFLPIGWVARGIRQSLEKIVGSYERIFGEAHLNTLEFMASLALSYNNEGYFAEAEKLQKQVLRTRRRILGDEHPCTVGIIVDLAATYNKQGRFEKADRISSKVLLEREQIPIEEDPLTLTGTANPASEYGNQRIFDLVEGLSVWSEIGMQFLPKEWMT